MGHSGRPSQELRVRAGRREAVDVFGVFWFFFFFFFKPGNIWRRVGPRGGRAARGKMAAAAAGAAPVVQGLKEALVDTLTGILSPVQEVRAAAEEQIKVLEVTEGE